MPAEQNLTIGYLELDAEATAALDALAEPGGEPIPFFTGVPDHA